MAYIGSNEQLRNALNHMADARQITRSGREVAREAAARIAALEAELTAARRCPLCGGRTQEIAVKMKPLVWEAFGTMAFIAEAPLFGRLRVEQFGRGNTWTVCFSVPGYSDTFLEGEWPDAETAKAAGQAEYERRILSTIEAAPVQSAQHRPSVAEAAKVLLTHWYNERGAAKESFINELETWWRRGSLPENYIRRMLQKIAGEDGQ